MPITRDAHVTPTITASGTTWTQYKTGELKIVIDNLVAANVAKANPSAALTTAVTTATGGLAAGDYFAAYSNCDAFGETTIGVSECASAFTVAGTTELCTLTVPALPTGVQSRNIYLTPANGASGSEILYATGITATSIALNITPSVGIGGVAVPASNTTGAAAHTERVYSILSGARSELTLTRLSQDLSTYLSGAPIPRQQIVMGTLAWTGIVKLWYTALSEIAVLVAANMPTASTSTIDSGGIGFPKTKWTIP